MRIAVLHRVVRLTARTSATLFAAAQVSHALRVPSAGAWRTLYVAFVTAHAVHFAAVARYAAVTNGRNLFPGGRNMNDVGGWPTVLGIFMLFFVLVGSHWASQGPAALVHPGFRRAGHAASAFIGAMYVSFYVGQLPRSRWYALPAGVIVAAVLTNAAAAARRLR